MRNVGLLFSFLGFSLCGCWLSAQTASEGPRLESKEVSPPVETQESFVTFQARLGLGPGEKISAVTDYEVSGPTRLAKQVCDALVRRHQQTVFPPESNLKSKVMRSCEVLALAEPESRATYAMVRVSRMRGVELLLAAELGNDVKVEGVQVRKRELTGYSELEACERDILKIREERQKSMREGALSFFEEQIQEQEKRVKEHCKVRTSKECKNSESLLVVLKEHRAQVDNGTQVVEGPSMICRKW